MSTKVRLVRCPKCRLVLPELPEICVYKCGGCNTVLQAKSRKPDTKEADENHEANENAIKETDCVSNITLSNENSAVSTVDASSSSPPRIEKGKDNTVPIPDSGQFENESPISSNEIEDSCLSPARIEHEKDNTVSIPDSGQFENEFPTSTEFTSKEVEDSCLSPARIEHEKDNTVSLPDSGQFENEFPTSTEFTSNELEDSCRSPAMIEHEKDNTVSLPDSGQFGNEFPTSTELEMEGSSVDLRNILGTEIDTDQYTEAEKTKRDYFESCHFSDDASPQDFEHEDSSDHHSPVLESTKSDLHRKDPDFTKSPTRSYYACDQVPNRSSKPPRRKIKPLNAPLKRATSELPSLLSSETEMRYIGYNNDSRLDDDVESKIHLSMKATFLEANNITRVPSNRYERRGSGFLRSDTTLLYNNVPDKLELLKTINDLKDELNRTRISNPSFPARFSLVENQHTWPCHHHEPVPRFSRIAYSGEATGGANCTCFRPQARYYSGGMPFLQEHETISKDLRRIPTDKDRSSKRYIIPEAGGIPILSCYHCSELLQFPVDFLLSSKKCHQLKCNTCRKIMNFSLENRRHLRVYTPEDDTVDPPPSMVDDYSQSSSLHSTSKPGISIDRSSSVKTEPHEASKHHHNHTRRNNSMEVTGYRGTRNDLKEVPSSSSGGAFRALHRLMGYASPSQVIRG